LLLFRIDRTRGQVYKEVLTTTAFFAIRGENSAKIFVSGKKPDSRQHKTLGGD